MSCFIIREANLKDVDDIYDLALLLNSFNLPADKEEIAKIITKSNQSFRDDNILSLERDFLFVLGDLNNKVVGCSQIFAKHGTLHSPHIYFHIAMEERYSSTLKKYFRHQVLYLGQNFDGPTEIGCLVLDKALRAQKEKWGRALSYVRFLFMAMRPEHFSNTVIAELLPPFSSDGGSPLWDAIGHKFIGLSYKEADILSRYNKEFILNLFPKGPIYASLLAKEAQDVIGRVGPTSMGAAQLLSQAGFNYNDRIDPFDGGPHYEAKTHEIRVIKDAKIAKPVFKNELTCRGMIARDQPFICIVADFEYNKESNEIALSKQSFDHLQISRGQKVIAYKFCDV